ATAKVAAATTIATTNADAATAYINVVTKVIYNNRGIRYVFNRIK
ncbi:7481_t:CDS:1, partial [Funneliformis geosporum]